MGGWRLGRQLTGDSNERFTVSERMALRCAGELR